jgi:hypothetical protein
LVQKISISGCTMSSMAVMKNIDNSKCWPEHGATGILI